MSTKVLQGSVSTRLRCDGIFHYTITTESEGEKILKIGQHLPKLWAISRGSFFMKHGVVVVAYFLVFCRIAKIAESTWSF